MQVYVTDFNVAVIDMFKKIKDKMGNVSREHKPFLKNQIEILEWKNAISKAWNSIDGLKLLQDRAEGDWKLNICRQNTQLDWRESGTENRATTTETYMIEKLNICVIWATEEKKRIGLK